MVLCYKLVIKCSQPCRSATTTGCLSANQRGNAGQILEQDISTHRDQVQRTCHQADRRRNSTSDDQPGCGFVILFCVHLFVHVSAKPEFRIPRTVDGQALRVNPA